MKIYTVLAYDSNGFEGIVVEPYATLDLAFKRAKGLVSNLCGEGSHIVRTLNGIKLEWAILDSDDPEHILYNDNGIYVAIWAQELATSLSAQNEDHYDAQAKHLAASICQAEDERILEELDTLKSMLTQKDDPGHWSLPAGWDKHHRPIFMQAVYDDPDCLLPLSELTDNEKFALTIARISDRPNYSFTFGSATWNQTSALEELSHYYRTWASYDIMENEIQHLQDIVDDYVNQSKAV